MSETLVENYQQKNDALQKIMLNVREMHEISGLSEGGIRRAITEGKLACVKIGVKPFVHQDVFFEFLRGTIEPVTAVNQEYGKIRRVG